MSIYIVAVLYAPQWIECVDLANTAIKVNEQKKTIALIDTFADYSCRFMLPIKS